MEMESHVKVSNCFTRGLVFLPGPKRWLHTQKKCIQQMFIECLLWGGPCARQWCYTKEQTWHLLFANTLSIGNRRLNSIISCERTETMFYLFFFISAFLFKKFFIDEVITFLLFWNQAWTKNREWKSENVILFFEFLQYVHTYVSSLI